VAQVKISLTGKLPGNGFGFYETVSYISDYGVIQHHGFIFVGHFPVFDVKVQQEQEENDKDTHYSQRNIDPQPVSQRFIGHLRMVIFDIQFTLFFLKTNKKG